MVMVTTKETHLEGIRGDILSSPLWIFTPLLVVQATLLVVPVQGHRMAIDGGASSDLMAC